VQISIKHNEQFGLFRSCHCLIKCLIKKERCRLFKIEDAMFEIPMSSMETMMKLSIIMGGMLFFSCSVIFAADVWNLLARKVWKKKTVSSV